jgi:hypothetical protein
MAKPHQKSLQIRTELLLTLVTVRLCWMKQKRDLDATDEAAHGATFREVCKERGFDPRAAGNPGAGESSHPLPIFERIAKLLRFATTHTDSETQDVAFADYVSRMKEGQDKIYYVTADTFAAAKNSPHLEVFRKKGIEVLLLAERIDEWMVGNLHEFEGKALQSVAKGELDLGKLADAAEKEEQEKASGEHKELVEKVQKALGERVKEVRVTLRLTTQHDAVVVPNEAIQTGQNGQFVYVVKGDRTVEARDVVPGSRVGQDMVVNQGLEAGETVVTEGQLRLAPGSKVVVRDGRGGGRGRSRG